MIYFSYINIHWNYLLYEVVERAVPLILWYSRYILLCCSTENQYLSYNFYLFLPYNGGSNNDDNTILSNNVDAWDQVSIYTYERWDPLTDHFDVCSMQSLIWAVGKKYNFWNFSFFSFWCLHWANIKMSSECISLFNRSYYPL